uniref:Uncharacterized protein n=1 Tax=Aegilops tauschii subsp. strangulata TaxID=200361 RepID=A0A452YW75_AEGTS
MARAYWAEAQSVAVGGDARQCRRAMPCQRTRHCGSFASPVRVACAAHMGMGERAAPRRGRARGCRAHGQPAHAAPCARCDSVLRTAARSWLTLHLGRGHAGAAPPPTTTHRRPGLRTISSPATDGSRTGACRSASRAAPAHTHRRPRVPRHVTHSPWVKHAQWRYTYRISF